MITIKINNTHGQIMGGIEEQIARKLYKSCSFRQDGFQFSRLYKSGRWDGYTRLLTKKRLKFRIGLLPKIIKELWPLEYELEDESTYSDPSLDLSYVGGLTLVDFQRGCVDTAVQSMRGLISLPTGTGKTLIMANMIAELQRKTCFICDELILIDQARETLRECLGVPIGEISGRDFDIQDITVCSDQSLCAALDLKYEGRVIKGNIEYKREILAFIEDTEVVMVDECHIVPANSIFDLLSHFKKSDHVFGATATPYRLDKRDLMMEAAIGPIIYDVGYKMAFESGLILKPEFKFIEVPEADFKKEWGAVGENKLTAYNEIYSTQVVNNSSRNAMIADMVVNEVDSGNIVLICVKQIEHGKEITRQIRGYGVQAEFACSKTHDRTDIIKRYRNGDIPVLISTLVHRGFDAPKAAVLILAAGGRDAIQPVGRVLRRDWADDSKQPVVYDLCDGVKYLDKHARERKRRYEKFGLLS